MDDIKIYKKPELTSAVMIAGWPGMGNVALGVVDYLRRRLNITKFAEIKVDPLSTLDSVIVDEGLASLPQSPQNIFYYSKNPDLIIFEGEAQLPGRDGLKLLAKVLDIAVGFKVKRIYTGAAFPIPISHKDAPEVYAASNKKALLEPLRKLGVAPMDGGHISGLNGLMLGFALERNIDAICLLATMPQYAVSIPNPKASAAIIEVLSKILNIRIDLQGLSSYIKDMDEKMALIEDKVKDVFTLEKAEPEPYQAEKNIPPYITEKIEKLFKEAMADKEKAAVLKIELDRWDLYKAYEDRFLDLFKKR